MIDIHMHIGRLYLGMKPLTARYLLSLMDRHGIEKACLLPMENPEFTHFYVTNEEILRLSAGAIPSASFPFATSTRAGKLRCAALWNSIATRGSRDSAKALPRCPSMIPAGGFYAICGEFGWPVILDIMGGANIDALGFPRYQRMLRELPQTVFLGHAMHFSARSSGDARPSSLTAIRKAR